jgi:2'-5' RNA ligase
MSKHSKRLFVGLDLDDATRKTMLHAIRELTLSGVPGPFEPAEKQHVTLAFLGSVDEPNVEPLIEALRDGLQNARRFRVRFDLVSAFPNERRARIVWAGARNAEPTFVDLAETVREAARQFAKLDEKKAVLHVTLARLREPMTLPRIAIKPSELRVNEVVLFESLPDGKTTRYEIVERFSLTDHTSSPEGSR